MYGNRRGEQQWPPPGWYQPRQTVAQRAGRAVAAGAGRAATAGIRRAGARRRPGMPLLVALVAHAAAGILWVLRWLHLGDATWTLWTDAGIALAVALAMVWPWRFDGPRNERDRRPVHWRGLAPRFLRWPAWRRTWLALATALLLAYLPVTAWWTIGPPVIYVSPVASLGMWAWLYVGHYRIREVPQDEPDEEYGPVERWDDEIGAPGKFLPGSRLTAVRDIEAPV